MEPGWPNIPWLWPLHYSVLLLLLPQPIQMHSDCASSWSSWRFQILWLACHHRSSLRVILSANAHGHGVLLTWLLFPYTLFIQGSHFLAGFFQGLHPVLWSLRTVDYSMFANLCSTGVRDCRIMLSLCGSPGILCPDQSVRPFSRPSEFFLEMYRGGVGEVSQQAGHFPCPWLTQV